MNKYIRCVYTLCECLVQQEGLRVSVKNIWWQGDVLRGQTNGERKKRRNETLSSLIFPYPIHRPSHSSRPYHPKPLFFSSVAFLEPPGRLICPHFQIPGTSSCWKGIGNENVPKWKMEMGTRSFQNAFSEIGGEENFSPSLSFFYLAERIDHFLSCQSFRKHCCMAGIW